MRLSYNRGIYDSLDEFIKEYSKEYNLSGENSRGMDFTYKDEEYRICREYDEVYYIYKEIDDGKTKDFEIINICNSMEELLNDTSIKNVKFSEIVMDEENTIIHGKD